MAEPHMTIEKTVTIKNKQGLHARPAALFVQIANKFNSEIIVTKGKHKVNGKSIMGIMMLEAGFGSRVTMVASGADAEQAVGELEALLVNENIDDSVL
jgi:phosphocarrier protein